MAAFFAEKLCLHAQKLSATRTGSVASAAAAALLLLLVTFCCDRKMSHHHVPNNDKVNSGRLA